MLSFCLGYSAWKSSTESAIKSAVENQSPLETNKDKENIQIASFKSFREKGYRSIYGRLHFGSVESNIVMWGYKAALS